MNSEWQDISTAPKDVVLVVALDPECSFSGADRVTCARLNARDIGTGRDPWQVAGTGERLFSAPIAWQPAPNPPADRSE